MACFSYLRNHRHTEANSWVLLVMPCIDKKSDAILLLP